MKKVLFSLVLLVIGFCASAQESDKTFKVGVGVTAGLPIGDIKDYTSFAIAGDLQGEYAVAESVGVTLSAGYLKFTGKNGVTTDGLIPVLVGGKFKFAEKIYGHAQLGLSFSTASGGGSAFTYAPSIGYEVSENLDLSLKYWAATKNSFTNSFIGVRIGYSF